MKYILKKIVKTKMKSLSETYLNRHKHLFRGEKLQQEIFFLIHKCFKTRICYVCFVTFVPCIGIALAMLLLFTFFLYNNISLLLPK